MPIKKSIRYIIPIMSAIIVVFVKEKKEGISPFFSIINLKTFRTLFKIIIKYGMVICKMFAVSIPIKIAFFNILMLYPAELISA